MQGRATKKKKYAGEDQRGWGKYKKHPQTKKSVIFSSLIPKVGNTSGLFFFFDRGSLEVLEQAQRTRSTSQLAPGQRLAGTTGAASPACTDATSFLEVDSLRMREKWLESKERMSRGKKERLVGAGLRLQCSSR